MLPPNVQNSLLTVVNPKFAAYFAFAPNNKCIRGIRTGETPEGKPVFTYPNDSMISDLTVLWSLFCEVNQLFKSARVNIPTFFEADNSLQGEIRRIIEDGEFWDSPDGPRSLRRVSLEDAVPARLPEIWTTLRNGYAHFHWLFENLSASDYWERMGWSTATQLESFGLQSRVPDNYRAYIADANGWNAARFWDLNDLRIIVTPYHILRYHLHLFLNILLNGDHHDVFGNLPI